MKDESILARLLGEWLVCEGDVSVEAFIARHPDHADLLRHHFALEELVEHAFEPHTELPERVGPFRIEAELGTGGMGTVYRAVATESEHGLAVGDTVALKIVHPHLFRRRGFFKRFLREAELGRRIDHANVVRTLDVDAVESDDRPQHYLVMEYVEGQTLRGLMDELDRVPEELARHIGCEVAKALSAIHAAGAVHRDLKPENVLITPDHVVKVMDLGVARLTDEQVRLSQTGAFVGSLHYAAPEQFGARTEVDFRADLHGLGLLLYEVATGTNPYAHEDVGAAMHLILTETPRKAGELNPQLSPFFEELLARLLEKDPAARFDSAEEVLRILEEAEQSSWWFTRAKEVRASSKRPLRRIRVPRETGVYGRDEHLARLQALYAAAKAGEGQVLLIEGEAGIGKTRLVDEFLGRLRDDGEDLNFLFASYPPGGAATASGAISAAFREHFGDEDLEETLKHYLRPTPVLVPAFAALLRGESTPTGAEALTKDSVQTVFVHATQALAAERTTIVLIDDLHFAPEGGRALFASLALAVPEHRVLLVGTMRPGVPEDWIANVERHDHALKMGLSRLGAKDLSSLLKDAFRSERLAEELSLRIAEKSDGNPFFVFEIIRGLREGQLITQEIDGTWIRTHVIKDIQIPSSVMDLIQARLSDLNEEEKDLLDIASCCGYGFDPSLLAAVSGVPLVPTLKRLARIEKAHGLIRSAGMGFVFDHHQVQEALYEGLPGMLRQEYHAAVAEALESREGAVDKDPEDLDGRLSVKLCEHFFKGARSESALRYLPPALRQLEAGYLNDQMITLADRALEVDGLLERKARVDVLLGKNACLHLLGRREAQEAVLQEARTLAAEEDETTTLADVEMATGKLLLETGRPEEARSHYERARALFQATGVRKGEADAMNGLGLALQWLSRFAEARAQHERALAIRREIGDKAGETASAGNLAVVFDSLVPSEEARAQHERVIDLARECGHRLFESTATGNLAGLLLTQGRFDEARTQYERALVVAREIGARSSEARHRLNLAQLAAEQGFAAEALDACARALPMARETGERYVEAHCLRDQGINLAALGAWEEAEASVRAGLDITRGVGIRSLTGSLLGILATCVAGRGDLHAAVALREEALSEYEAMGSRSSATAAAHLRYGALLRELGRVVEARRSLQTAVAMARESGAIGVSVSTLTHLALLDGGDPAQAVEALEEDAKRLGPALRMETSFLLYQATGDRRRLADARNLLTFLVEHAPDGYRESMLKNVRLYREIMEAWEEQGDEGKWIM